MNPLTLLAASACSGVALAQWAAVLGASRSSGGGTPAYVTAVLATSPIGYWRMNESSGTSALDSISTNNGTYNGGFTLGSTALVTGDTSALLNGSTGYMEIPYFSALNTTTGSVVAWFKTSADGTVIRRDNGSERNWLVDITGGKLRALLIYGGNPSVTSAATVTDGNTHMAVLVWTASGGSTNFELFLDGASAGTNTSSANDPATSRPIQVGRYEGSSDYLNGNAGEVSYYNVALSSGQISTLWAAR